MSQISIVTLPSTQFAFQFQTFSEDNHETIKTVGYTMAMVEAHANFAIEWLKDSLPKVQEWLTANNATETST